MTEYDLRTKHPSELSAKERREALEYRSLGRNELLIFNLPNEQTVESVTKLVSVKGVHV